MKKEGIEYYDLSQLYPWDESFFRDFIHGSSTARKLTHEILLSHIYSKNSSTHSGGTIDFHNLCGNSNLVLNE